MKIKFGFTLKLTLGFLLFSAFILGAASLLAYSNGRAALQSAAVTELYSTAFEKQSALNTWVVDAEAHATALSSSPFIQEQTAGMVTAQAAGEQAAAQAAHDQLVAELQAWTTKDADFLEWMVLDASSGQVIAATVPGDEGKFKEDQPFFTNGIIGPYVQNVYYSTSNQGVLLTVSAPIRSPQGMLLGVLAGNLDLTKMTAIIAQRTGLRQSSDAFLVNTSELFVTQPRFISNPVVLLRGIHTPAVKLCLAHNSGEINAPDYRGVPSVIVYRWLPDRQVCLIVKMSQAEVFAPAVALRNNIALISILALLAAAILTYWLAHNVTRPVHQLVQAAQAIGAGKLDTPIAVKTGDEIEQLAGALAQMAHNLQNTMVSRDNLLAEIAERKQAQEQLVTSEMRYRRLFEAALDGIFILDAETGVVVDVNPFLITMLGYPREEILGKELWELGFLKDIASSKANFLELKQKNYIRYEDLPLETADGRISHVEFISNVYEVNHHRVIQCNIRDINERWKTQEELRRSNAELERFAYIASHDLQEPLRMVASYLQLLERRYKGQLDQDADEFINYAVDGANRMKALINDLLAYSRVGTRGKEFAPVDCEEVLQGVLANLQVAIAENNAVITHDALPQVMGDAVQLESLFQNLLSNALKFRGEKPPLIHIGVTLKDTEWVFSVCDNGIGIEPQYFERIFIIFQRLNSRQEYPGTGIGLAISKRIVERHGGRMWIESQPGKGSTFYFTLPK
jgi:PAS domain S-box-containing protein